MSKYVKPVVLSNECLTEDVWATNLSSGSPLEDCWTIDVYRSQQAYYENERYIHCFRVHGVHGDPQHISLNTMVEIVFSDNLENFIAEDMSWIATKCGNVGIVTRDEHANAYTSSDNFDYLVKAYTLSPQLEAWIGSYTCKKTVNVQGNGGDGT